MSALGYYVPGEQEQHRHPVSAEARRLHLGFPALRASLGGHLRQGRTGQALRKRLERYMEETGHLLRRAPRFTATCCRRSKPQRGRRTAWRATAGWRWATPPAWSIPSPAKVCTTRCAPADLAARRCLTKSADWPDKAYAYRAAAARFRRRPGVRLAPRQARVPGPLPVRHRCRRGWSSSRAAARASRPSCRICSPARSPISG